MQDRGRKKRLNNLLKIDYSIIKQNYTPLSFTAKKKKGCHNSFRLSCSYHDAARVTSYDTSRLTVTAVFHSTA